MVNTSDSRLLTNLLTHEKDYAKSLHALLSPPPSQALAAYAAASPPPLSHVILQVSQALGRADEALGRYADGVEEGRDVLKRVKELEEEVKVVLRDREILVTRLLKASKSSKNLKSSPNGGQRDSSYLGHLNLTSNNTSPAASSLSLGSAWSSPSPLPINLPLTGGTNGNAKLTHAQAELQACEATLAQKKSALQVGRAEALRDGLGLRCRAMVECGWVWGEMGRQALEALDRIDLNIGSAGGEEQSNAYPSSSTHPYENEKSLHHEQYPNANQNQNDYTPPPSRQSQQQQQQQRAGNYYLPPAHAISDSEPFPSFSTSHPNAASTPQRHVLARRITEEDFLRKEEDEEGGSSIDEPEPGQADVRVIDNPRFFKAETTPTPAPSPAHGHGGFGIDGFRIGGHKRGQSTASFGGGGGRTAEGTTPSPKKGFLGRRVSGSQRSPDKGRGGEKEKEGGGGFFGSLRGLFGGGGGGLGSHHDRDSDGAAFYEHPGARDSSDGGLFGLGKRKAKGRDREREGWGKGKGKWETRTEKNLRELEREGMSSGPATEAYTYAHMRESVSGRGRVVSETAGAVGGGKGKAGAKAGAATDGEVSGDSAAGVGGVGGAGRKLRKGRSPPPPTGPTRKKSRSSSVPPPTISAPIRLASPTPTGPGTLFAGTEIARQREAFLAGVAPQALPPPTTTTTQNTFTPQTFNAPQTTITTTTTPGSKPLPNGTGSGIKRQRSARKPPPPVNGVQNGGVREGLTYTVVGSANPNNGGLGRRTSASANQQTSGMSRQQGPPMASGSGSGISRNNSVRSAASAPPGVRGVGAGGSGSGKKKRASSAPPRVEDVLRNQELGMVGLGGSEGGGGAPTWTEVRAPASVFDQLGEIESGAFGVGGGGEIGGIGVGGGRENPASSEGKKDSSRPAKSPLRSALRNPSRTPSPMPLLHLQHRNLNPQLQMEGNGQAPQASSSSSQATSLSQVQLSPPSSSQVHAPPANGYESGLESALGPVAAPAPRERRVSTASNDSGDDVFYEADDGTRAVDAPAQPALTPNDAPPGPGPTSSESGAQPNGNPAEALQEAPVPERRRKSVRVSLNPTFSVTPPALEYEYPGEDGEYDAPRVQPWMAGIGVANGHAYGGDGHAAAYGGEGSTGGHGKMWGRGGEKEREAPDMWEDSSDEDVEYARARSLLSLLGKKEKKGRTINWQRLRNLSLIFEGVISVSHSLSRPDRPAPVSVLHIAPAVHLHREFSTERPYSPINPKFGSSHGPPNQHFQHPTPKHHCNMSDDEHRSRPQDDVKAEDANATINIKVVSSTGEEVFFKIKRSTKLSKLQGAYANKVGKDVSSIRFLYDGTRISEDDTPTTLDMEDN
ncbi:hypothetical protein C0991_010253, partial [Blastosporella zonata]